MKLFAIQKLVRSNTFYISHIRKYRLKIESLVISLIALKMISKKFVREILGRTKFAGDGFITRNYVGGFMNSKLDSAWNSSIDKLPKNIQQWNSEIKYRAHIVTWAANQTKEVEGDFIELGVFFGHLSYVIVNFDQEVLTGRKFFLVDPWGKDGAKEFTNVLYRNDIYDFVKSRFADYPEVELIRGFVPEVLAQIPSSRVAFLMIDMNGHEAEIAALEHFYNRMSTGGIIYFDDYGGRWTKLREVVDEFLFDKPEKLLTFASPNAILIKK